MIGPLFYYQQIMISWLSSFIDFDLSNSEPMIELLLSSGDLMLTSISISLIMMRIWNRLVKHRIIWIHEFWWSVWLVSHRFTNDGQMKNLSKEEFVHILRRHSTGFSRGSSKYRGVTLHKCGRWEARMGQLLGKKWGFTLFKLKLK